FGACPRDVLDHQSALRAELEAEPVRFLSRELDDRLEVARAALAGFLGAGVLSTPLPCPLGSPDEVVEAVLAKVTPRTRLALLDHVTSPTGLVLPIERLIAELSRRGVEVLVDGAHAPGMVPLDLNALGATYYSGNCHKWLCAPKGSAFLWTRTDRHPRRHPHVPRPLSLPDGVRLDRHQRSHRVAHRAQGHRVRRLALAGRL